MSQCSSEVLVISGLTSGSVAALSVKPLSFQVIVEVSIVAAGVVVVAGRFMYS